MKIRARVTWTDSFIFVLEIEDGSDINSVEVRDMVREAAFDLPPTDSYQVIDEIEEVK
jgi:hypothetical protein